MTKQNNQIGPLIAIDAAEELRFTKSQRVQHIELQNLTEKRVAFKVKENEGQHLTIVPNSGFLEGNRSKSLQITLASSCALQETFIIMTVDPQGEENQIKLWQMHPAGSPKVYQHKMLISPPIAPEASDSSSRKNELRATIAAKRRSSATIVRDIVKLQKEMLAKEQEVGVNKIEPEIKMGGDQFWRHQYYLFILILCFVLLAGYEIGASRPCTPST